MQKIHTIKESLFETILIARISLPSTSQSYQFTVIEETPDGTIKYSYLNLKANAQYSYETKTTIPIHGTILDIMAFPDTTYSPVGNNFVDFFLSTNPPPPASLEIYLGRLYLSQKNITHLNRKLNPVNDEAFYKKEKTTINTQPASGLRTPQPPTSLGMSTLEHCEIQITTSSATGNRTFTVVESTPPYVKLIVCPTPIPPSTTATIILNPHGMFDTSNISQIQLPFIPQYLHRVPWAFLLDHADTNDTYDNIKAIWKIWE